MIAYDLAARVTTGANWPDGSKGCAPGGVMVYTAEDEWGDTIIPRLMATGTDLSRIHRPDSVYGKDDEVFDPARHIDLVRQDLEHMRDEISLFIIDPIVDVVDGDMNAANVVRKALYPWKHLSSDLDLAVLGISHLRKGSRGDTGNMTERVIGSGAFTQVSRNVLIASKSKQHDCRVLAKAKVNIGKEQGGFKYSIDSVLAHSSHSPKPYETGRVLWGEYVQEEADDIFADDGPSEKPKSKLEQAKQFVLETLHGGPVAATTLKESAEESEISDATLRRAMDAVGVVHSPDGFGGAWMASLPASVAQESQS